MRAGQCGSPRAPFDVRALEHALRVVVGLEQERRHGSEEQRPADALGAVGAEVARHLPTAHREGRLIALTEAVDVIVVPRGARSTVGSLFGPSAVAEYF